MSNTPYGGDELLDALVDICGPDFARAGRSVDTVAGQRARYVAVPATTAAVSDVLALAAAAGLTVVPRGSGSKIEWGRSRPADLFLDSARLGGVWHHDVAGRTVEVGTGTPVRALQAALALRGQRLTVDPPSRTATVGGMLAVNESGPLRHRFGTPAEHVDSVAYVAVDGTAGESDGEDGRPGIAQIDGVITSAVIRLQDVPSARLWVGTAVSSPLRMQALIEDAQSLEPSAVEVDLPRPVAHQILGRLAVLFEGDDEDVAERADHLVKTWGSGAAISTGAPGWWGRYPFGRDEVALRISVSTFDLPSVIYTVGDATGSPVPVRGSAGVGSVYAVLPGDISLERLGHVLDGLRHVLIARGGQVMVVSAPLSLARQVDMATRRELF